MDGNTLSTLNFENEIQRIADKCSKQDRLSESEQVKSEPEKPTIIVPRKYQNCSFDTFEGNDKLVDALRTLTETGFDGIVLTGNTGCGKTHLAVSLMKALVDKENIFCSVFTTAPELLLRLRESFRESAMETEDMIIRAYTNSQLLVLDDLGSEKTSEYTITSLYIILDRRDREMMSTIVTTNLSLREIEEKLGARIASRLSAWRNIKINMPDYRKRR
jgi:DNA replication protein DnaC